MKQNAALSSLDVAAFDALVRDMRPDLHRYCARLTGSIFDGEDVVQDALAKAHASLSGSEVPQDVRAWLFRVAHNRALDVLRSRSLRAAKPLVEAEVEAASDELDPLEALLRQEAMRTAITRFVALPIIQRSVVLLKDVLGHSLGEIAALLDTTVDGVNGHLARGRAKLAEINASALDDASPPPPSALVARYVALFNARDWHGLRTLLAEDVVLHQSTYPTRHGAEDVGTFFTIYARNATVHLKAAWVEGREVVAVYENGPNRPISHVMWLMWKEDRIAFIRDYRYVPYVVEGADWSGVGHGVCG